MAQDFAVCQADFSLTGVGLQDQEEPLGGKTYHLEVAGTANLTSMFAGVELENQNDGPDATTLAGGKTVEQLKAQVADGIMQALENGALTYCYTNDADLPTQGAGTDSGLAADVSSRAAGDLPRKPEDGTSDMDPADIGSAEALKIAACIAFHKSISGGDYVASADTEVVAATPANQSNRFYAACDSLGTDETSVAEDKWVNRAMQDFGALDWLTTDDTTASGITSGKQTTAFSDGNVMYFRFMINFAGEVVTNSHTAAESPPKIGTVELSLKVTHAVATTNTVITA